MEQKDTDIKFTFLNSSQEMNSGLDSDNQKTSTTSKTTDEKKTTKRHSFVELVESQHTNEEKASHFSEATEKTILSLIDKFINSCQQLNCNVSTSWTEYLKNESISSVPTPESIEEELYLVTGRLHTLLLGQDTKMKSFISRAFLGEVDFTAQTSETDISKIVQWHSRGCAPIDSATEMLVNCSSSVIAAVILALFHQLLAPTNEEDLRERVCCSLVSNGCVNATLKCMQNIVKVQGFGSLEAVVVPAYQVLTKLIYKDDHGLLFFRLTGGLSLTHDILKSRLVPNSSPTLPVLMFLKIAAKNGGNQLQLGRHGCVATIIKMLNTTSTNHMNKLKYLLDILASLTVPKSNALKAVREGAVCATVRVLTKWQRFDQKMLPKLMKSGIAVFSHIADTKKGRRSIEEDGGVQFLKNFAFSCPSNSKLDSLVCSAANVCLKCCSTVTLPLPSSGTLAVTPVMRFTPPIVEKKLDTVDTVISEPLKLSHGVDRERSPMSESDEEDDDLDTEMDTVNEQQGNSESDKTTNEEFLNFPKIPQDQLVNYCRFFPELFDFKRVGVKDSVDWSGSTIRSAGVSASEAALRITSETKSISPCFVKVAYPDLVAAGSVKASEKLRDKEEKMSRFRAVTSLHRLFDGGSSLYHVVYDLDALLHLQQARHGISRQHGKKSLNNADEKRVGRRDVSARYLHFESRFEGGNLRRAMQVGDREYDLVLNTDVSSTHHHQWFYFEVSNMEAQTAYTFNIINNEKPSSEFNEGMQPVLFSVKESLLGRSEWTRTGSRVSYFRNHYRRPCKPGTLPYSGSSGTRKTQWYYTATFTVEFKHPYDVCYLAYHYPYGYSRLRRFICSLHEKYEEQKKNDKEIYFDCQTVTHTLLGNPVPLITITSNLDDNEHCDNIVGTTDKSHHKGSTIISDNSHHDEQKEPSIILDNRDDNEVLTMILDDHNDISGPSLNKFMTSEDEVPSSLHNTDCDNLYFSSDVYWLGTDDKKPTHGREVKSVYCEGNERVFFTGPRPLSTLCKTLNYEDVFGEVKKEENEEDIKSEVEDNVAFEKGTPDNISVKKFKPVIFLSSRVHPGESNSSWVMEGTLSFLLSAHPEARLLRRLYTFKVVPMLNPDGVIHGNTRCGLTDEDLNRRWKNPCPTLHPEIFNVKALLEFLTSVVGSKLKESGYKSHPVRLFCDYHGHSRQKNLFLYGCSRQLSWNTLDKIEADYPSLTWLAAICNRTVPSFSSTHCRYTVEKYRETTARVAVWRQFGIELSYTLEASAAGCDQGIYKGYHLNTHHLLESGWKFCASLYDLHLLSVSDASKLSGLHPRVGIHNKKMFSRSIVPRDHSKDNFASFIDTSSPKPLKGLGSTGSRGLKGGKCGKKSSCPDSSDEFETDLYGSPLI